MSTVPSMSEYELTYCSNGVTDDYRLLCGNLGNEVNDDVLSKAFSRIPTFNRAKVVRNKQTGKTIWLIYVGNRPIILCKSKSRTDYEALERRRART
ncbi:hypothetical protein R3W88_011049 [Solanum pinnatisectum]|uniref:RRM domain-containing protein n=1 Tax=Solanum pinnatisectum TaxID=50273 RepID=A0AAV9L575_9SOLN|nr:hypothetical protein R3W88_011049 [Solanum pinnatisectum]